MKAPASTTFVSVREYAQMRGLSCKLLYQLVETGHLPHFRFGRRIVINVEQADQWAAKAPIKKSGGGSETVVRKEHSQ